MKKLALVLATMVALAFTAAPAFADNVDQTSTFVNDLTFYVKGAVAIVHDNTYKLATNQPLGSGFVYEQWIDQHGHGGLAVVVGEQCANCEPIVHFYSNGDGTYNTITTFERH